MCMKNFIKSVFIIFDRRVMGGALSLESRVALIPNFIREYMLTFKLKHLGLFTCMSYIRSQHSSEISVNNAFG